jgi:hypothetical protein
MKQLPILLLIGALLGLSLVGCDKEQGAVTDPALLGVAPAVNGDNGVEVTSAILHIWQESPTLNDLGNSPSAPVYVHAVTSPWQELTVTYATLPTYNPTPLVNTFTVNNTVGERMVDVTSLAKGWWNDPASNFGILLREDKNGVHPLCSFYSSDWSGMSVRPYLEIKLTTPSGNTVTRIIRYGLPGAVVEDAFVKESEPTGNFGGSTWLYTGTWSGLEKISLIRFAFAPYELGCTRTIGYWKTHAGFGPQANVIHSYLPVWLGTAGGGASKYVNNETMAVQILSMDGTFGRPSNGISKLYAQLLGAKLNIAAGAGSGSISSIIAAADAFLATHDWTTWSTGLTTAQKNQVLSWQSDLDAYNNGLSGPMHCN